MEGENVEVVFAVRFVKHWPAWDSRLLQGMMIAEFFAAFPHLRGRVDVVWLNSLLYPEQMPAVVSLIETEHLRHKEPPDLMVLDPDDSEDEQARKIGEWFHEGEEKAGRAKRSRS